MPRLVSYLHEISTALFITQTTFKVRQKVTGQFFIANEFQVGNAFYTEFRLNAVNPNFNKTVPSSA